MSDDIQLPEDEALAAEHALGLLDAPGRRAAEARMARDPAFAAAVEAWRERLTPLLDEVEPVEAPAGLLARIERRLPANENGRATFWRRIAVAASGLAAASVAAVVVMAARPEPARPMPPMLNAHLWTSRMQPMFVVAYDPMRKALVVSSLAPAQNDPGEALQLWLIPEDGRPRSLGMVKPGMAMTMPIDSDMAPMVEPGASIAVSVEPQGGSPSPEGPSGPIAAKGELSPV